MDRPATFVRHPRTDRRPRRGLVPAVRPLEGRRLLSGGPPAAAGATMTQTATFPDLEANPALSDQSLLYFNGLMGTLTEVDVTVSGSFQTRMAAENTGSTPRTVSGTTSANLSVDLPSGSLPVVIPPVTQSFNASAFDGVLDDAGTSGKTFGPATSSAAPRTTVLTAPAALAAFSGHFRMPVGVSGHATGTIAPGGGKVSGSIQTDTSVTITVVYHYVPTLPSTGPTTGDPGASPGGASPAPGSSGGGIQAISAHPNAASAHDGGQGSSQEQATLHRRRQHPHHHHPRVTQARVHHHHHHRRHAHHRALTSMPGPSATAAR